MEDFDFEAEHPKKRRRRVISRQPVAARLIFDDHVAPDVAALSPELWTEIVGESRAATHEDGERRGSSEKLNDKAKESLEQVQKIYIGLSPVTSFDSSLDETSWTIVPATTARPTSPGVERQPIRYTISLAPDTLLSQSFLRLFDSVDSGRTSHHVPRQIDVRVSYVEPVTLDTVFVTVEKGLLQKVDEIQSRFGGGFHGSRAGKLEHRPSIPKQEAVSGDEKTRLTSLVRKALSQLPVVHSGDVFPLPLPSHPITHVRPAPAIAMHCEPVLQGRISASTKIVLVQAGSSQEKAIRQLQPPQPIIEESIEDTADETSNDQFFSAAEDRPITSSSEADEGISGDGSDSEESDDGSDESSDDSMEDLISLSAPTLPPQQSGTLSAMTSATPRPGDRRGSGMHTPGSVYSTFTSATARTGSRPGKVFRTEALIRTVPKQALHPKPSIDDDEEAFVFVDTSTLNKIGCFSGDWVRIEAAKNISRAGFPSLGLQGPDFSREDDDWRAVRIYGLANLPNQRLRYAVDKTGARRSSFSSMHSRSLTPSIYLPPSLLHNIRNVPFVKVGILPRPPRRDSLRDLQSQVRPSTSNSPPLAKEVNLLKILTPFTKRKDLEPILFSSLKRHFENRKRILKKGDIFAIAVDQQFGRTTFSPASSVEDPGFEEGLAVQLGESTGANDTSPDSLAWFRVEHIATEPIQDLDDIDRRDSWGGVATIDPFQTRLSQSGGCQQSIPPGVSLETKFWLKTRQLPKLQRPSTVIVTVAELPETVPSPTEVRLRDLIIASISPRAVSLGIPPSFILLHSTQRQSGKTYAAVLSCAAAGASAFSISGYELLAENSSTTSGGDVSTEGTLRARAEEAVSCGKGQTALLIQYIDVLSADRIVAALQDILGSLRVVIATTTQLDKISPGMRSLFTHELEVSAPDETAREAILQNVALTLRNPVSYNVSFKSIALQTAALVAGDLVDVIHRASSARSRRLVNLAESQDISTSDLSIAGGMSVTHLLQSDFTAAITSARSTFSDAIGAPKIPTVTWDDVGGLATQKDAIMETISLPLTHPELFANGIRKRSGILFYGPPGTGKTLLAKAIATEFSLNFFSVKGPELLNMYIGESEANVRRVFQRARDARPCVVFFDELDSVAPKRGNQGDSGGVMDRIVSQLLAELDGMSSGGAAGPDGETNKGGVFVIGATNRPDLLDPALLRPGRFDKMLYLGVASDHDQQVTILQALTRKFHLSKDVNLKRVASRLPLTYTGADLYALCSDAMLKAITRKTKAVDVKVAELSRQRGEPVSTGWFFDHIAGPEDIEVVVNDEDFVAAQRELVGSVSAKELDHFERIKRMFEAQDISSGTGQKNGDTSVKGKGKGKIETAQGEAKEPARPPLRLQRTNTALPLRSAGAEQVPSQIVSKDGSDPHTARTPASTAHTTSPPATNNGTVTVNTETAQPSTHKGKTRSSSDTRTFSGTGTGTTTSNAPNITNKPKGKMRANSELHIDKPNSTAHQLQHPQSKNHRGTHHNYTNQNHQRIANPDSGPDSSSDGDDDYRTDGTRPRFDAHNGPGLAGLNMMNGRRRSDASPTFATFATGAGAGGNMAINGAEFGSEGDGDEEGEGRLYDDLD